MRKLILTCLLSAGGATLVGCDTPPPARPDHERAQETQPQPSPQDAAAVEVAEVLEPALAGKEGYERVCVTCHGRTGDGQGLEQQLFGFGEPAERWANGPTVEGITRTLNDGIHETSMRPFPDIDDPHRVAIAKYVLILRGKLMAPEAAP